MAFSSEDKALIKNDFVEKGWSSYRIYQEHPSKHWNRVSVRRLLKQLEKYGSMNGRPGSGRPVTATTEENEEPVGDLICSQEENPGTHLSPREIEKITGISRTSMRRMVKRRRLKQFKRVKTPRTGSATQQRRTGRAGALAEKFSKKRSIERCVWKTKRISRWMFPSMLRTIMSMVSIKKIKFQVIDFFITQTNNP